MASPNINRVLLTGNLTRDPELRSTPGGTSVCSLRIAVNSSRKDASGEWVDKPNYFSVTVWGAQGENCAQYLAKGRAVAVDGRLDWREWQDKDGNKREAVEIVADRVQFLSPRDGGGSSPPATSAETAGAYGAPAASGQSALTAPAGQGGGGYQAPAAHPDDDIPF